MDVSEFRDLCSARGLAVTHQRQVIWDALAELHGHPSPEELYERVRQRIPSISLATVYKNVRKFIEHGLLSEVSLHHGSARLETNLTAHHHMVCVKCRTIVDLEDADIEPVRIRTHIPNDFRIQRYSVEVIGICKGCADTETAGNAHQAR